MKRRDGGPGRGAGGRGTASAAYPDDAYLDPAAYPVDPGYRGYSEGDRVRPADMPAGPPRPRAERTMPPRAGSSPRPAGRRRATPAASAAWGPVRTTPLPPAPVPGRDRVAAGRDRRVRVALALRGGMTFLSRTNRGLRPVAALLPRVDRAQAGSPVPRLAVPGRAAPLRDRPPAVRNDRDGQTRGTNKDLTRAMTRTPDTRLPARTGGSGRPRAGRTPQAARSTVPAGASAVQSRVSGDTVRASQGPTGTAPMNTVLTSVAASTATSGTGLTSTAPGSMAPASTGLTAGGTGAALTSSAQDSPGLTNTGLRGTGRASTALASAALSNTDPTSTDLRHTALSSTVLSSTAAWPAPPEHYGPDQYGPEAVRR